MRKLFTNILLIVALVLSSCTYDDTAVWNKLENHESRISTLEELCREMNTNISALQSLVDAMQGGDYITSIVPVTKDGNTIGYTITFAENEPITIYHGTNGKDGANGADGKDGADGYTPVIGVKQDTDGIYYWTLDGEWLLDDAGNKIKAQGVDGKDGTNGTDGTNGADGKDGEDGKDGTDGVNGTDGKDGQDGANGADGTNGKDGVDGITPQLKIEEGYWYVSYDNGASWTQLGKATGEDGQDGANGADGADGKDGDSFFADVVVGEDSVTFTLADGTVIVVPLKGSEDTSAENNKIYYTTADNKKMFPTSTEPSVFGAILISNVYKDGQGVLTFDDSVTTIGYSAFYNCTPLTSITIPDSVTTIGERAFYACTSLTSITIPDSVTEIGNLAFYNCTGELTLNCNCLGLYGGKFSKLIIGNSVTSIGDSAFAGCNSLTSVTIPDSVTSIGERAFYRCSSLESFYGKLASEDNRCLIVDGKLIAFAPAGLIEYTIPDSVTSIGYAAFYGCSSLTSVIIPDSVTSIGNYAFGYCTSLTNVTIPDSVTSIGDYAFENCDSLTSVTIGNSVTSIRDWAFSDCDSLKSVTIPDSVTTIGSDAFSNCTSLTSITIPDSVTSIGSYAFYYCSSLTSVTIPDSVTTIEESAFSYCSSLESFYGKFASEDNRCLIVDGKLIAFAPASLIEYTIPDSVTSIGDYAFAGCNSLTSVTIPDSVTSIGSSTFFNCTSLTSVYCKPATPPSLGGYAFKWYDDGIRNFVNIGCTIYVPTASVEAYKSAAGWSDYKNYIVGYKF